jgi:hypothetical protein
VSTDYQTIEYVLSTQTIRARNLRRAGVLLTDASDVDSMTFTLLSELGASLGTGAMIFVSEGVWEGAVNGPATAQIATVKVEAISGSSRGRWKQGVRFVDF